MTDFTFENDDELAAWFEEVDLASLPLEEAHDVTVSTPLEITVTEPWAPTNGSPGSPGSGTPDTISIRFPQPA